MGEGALLLGPALANSQTILPPVEPVSHGGEDRDGRLTFHRLDDDCHRRRAPRCFGGLPLPVPPLRQAAVGVATHLVRRQGNRHRLG